MTSHQICASHYLNQEWPNSATQCGITMPQWFFKCFIFPWNSCRVFFLLRTKFNQASVIYYTNISCIYYVFFCALLVRSKFNSQRLGYAIKHDLLIGEWTFKSIGQQVRYTCANQEPTQTSEITFSWPRGKIEEQGDLFMVLHILFST